MAYTVPDIDPEDAWVTTSDASKQTGIPVSTLQNWARSGRGPIKARRLGGKWIWSREDILSLLPS